jgi:hypothetical protein
MINFQPDFGTEEKHNDQGLPKNLSQHELESHIGKRYTGLVDDINLAAKRRLDMHKLSQ